MTPTNETDARRWGDRLGIRYGRNASSQTISKDLHRGAGHRWSRLSESDQVDPAPWQ